ncbi:MAG: TetR/AcrR family transcriptional regulator [Candidatus Marinimicrobia bacterium]|nr:TetR/AcrR family transcriptional regulator [Candidatus Neomarinimicrobiota bacterium]MBT4359423.1 TetR/AcrR family transcriptional regulator [Candidatus Neomarinimicrobiota bacterium]MBT4715953.1 TetR/AcrR family transcriptional regulator [Candidatus Neomarinimicrobiota bacterium]MBT4948114.1 TetR/AcrR family transcriptional regulator [Candidatus Neomarinimicrobiota bacterium]MBT5270996.1 TetR/AcrR family transcriptional regulator [Candidatus Neomarinimicrobiota bacterium]
MRVKDEIKQDAVIEATVALVNEIGFVSSSVSKIAKRAGVSPATIYIYFKNKEDLLVSTYIQIKTCLAQAIMENFDANLPVRDALLQAGTNLYAYISSHSELFYFTEQFANSPYADLVNRDEIEIQFKPLFDLIQYGVDQKIIKDAPFELLFAHLYLPIFSLVNPRMHPDFKATPENIELSMNMAWDAIKL